MSYVIAAPEMMTSAATDLSNIGSALTAANAAAATQTTGVLAAAEDEVSAAIAALFGAHAQEYQAAAAQAATFHEQFMGTLSAAAASYADTEATIARLLGSPLLGSAAAVSLAGVSDGFQMYIYGPIHTAGEAWIVSPLGPSLSRCRQPRMHFSQRKNNSTHHR